MDLLDSSLKAAVSFNSLSSPNKPAFEIYQDEALHDKILDQLHSKHIVTVKMASTTRNYDLYDEPKLSLRFISDSMKLHSQLSKVPPGTLEIVKIFNTYKPQPEECYMEVLKVAKVTGDLCIRLVGQYMDVINISKYIEYFTSNINGKFSLSILIPSHDLFTLPPALLESLQITLTESSYFLAPGTIVKLQSSSIDFLTTAALTILVNDNDTFNSFNTVRYNRPMSSGLKSFDSISLRPEIPQNIEVKSTTEVPDQIDYKMIQLTRPEVTFLIGKNGRKIEDIRRRSRAVVKVVPLNSEMNHDMNLRCKNVIQFIRVQGTKKQIRDALRIIEFDIYQFRNGGITTY